MKFNTKKLLKEFDKETIKKVLKLADLTETEYWVLYYSIVEKRMVINTCYKLSISQAQYFIIQKLALLKVDFALRKIIKI